MRLGAQHGFGIPERIAGHGIRTMLVLFEGAVCVLAQVSASASLDDKRHLRRSLTTRFPVNKVISTAFVLSFWPT